MLRVVDEKYITEMGFTKNGHDWVYIINVDSDKKLVLQYMLVQHILDTQKQVM